MSDIATLELRNISRHFTQGGVRLDVLHGVNLRVQPGEMVALVGSSGSGKTTLLQIAGLLDAPDAGEVVLLGESAHGMREAKRTVLRRSHIGFVYQFHCLLPEFSARENIMLPLMIADASLSDAGKRSDALLAELGIAARANHRPAELSGGEQQRVAIARALANSPKLLLADEPTGNLDPHTAGQVFALLKRLVRDHKLAALVATHNLELAQQMDRVLTMRDGRLQA